MAITQAQTQLSLYERLGGESGIRDIVDDIVEAHMANPVIRARFLPYREDPDKLATVKQHLCDFIGAGTGGPGTYQGRSMPDAHRGMNIAEEEYMAAVDDILATLDKHGVDTGSRQEMLNIAYALKGDIMRL